MILHFCRSISEFGDKQTILNTLTKVGVWNSNVYYLTLPLPVLFLSRPCFAGPTPIMGANGFAFVVGT